MENPRPEKVAVVEEVKSRLSDVRGCRAHRLPRHRRARHGRPADRPAGSRRRVPDLQEHPGALRRPGPRPGDRGDAGRPDRHRLHPPGQRRRPRPDGQGAARVRQDQPEPRGQGRPPQRPPADRRGHRRPGRGRCPARSCSPGWPTAWRPRCSSSPACSRPSPATSPTGSRPSSTGGGPDAPARRRSPSPSGPEPEAAAADEAPPRTTPPPPTRRRRRGHRDRDHRRGPGRDGDRGDRPGSGGGRPPPRPTTCPPPRRPLEKRDETDAPADEADADDPAADDAATTEES